MTKTDSTPTMHNLTVADIALNFPQSIRILNRYGLDYCCNGKKLFTKACKKAYVNPELVWNEILEESRWQEPEGRKFKCWETNLLIDYIIQHHHEYLRLTIPQIQELLTLVCGSHGYERPELHEILLHFNVLSEDLLNHLPKEETVLFPAIRRLAGPTADIAPSPLLANVKDTISIMEHEHGRVGELIRIIRKLSNDYEIAPHSGPTLHLVFKLLEEFEYDVMQHIHLENNILFPKIRQ